MKALYFSFRLLFFKKSWCNDRRECHLLIRLQETISHYCFSLKTFRSFEMHAVKYLQIISLTCLAKMKTKVFDYPVSFHQGLMRILICPEFQVKVNPSLFGKQISCYILPFWLFLCFLSPFLHLIILIM